MNIKGLDDLKTNKNKKSDGKEDPSKAKKTTYAGGEKSGILIEDNSDPSSALISKAKNQGSKNESKGQKIGVKLGLYKNGIHVDSTDEFYSFDTQEGREMMKDLMEEKIPKNLRSIINEDTDVGIEDRRSDVYEKKVEKKPFQGEGISLGNPNLEMKIESLKIDTCALTVNQNEAIHELMLKYPNGEKKVIQVNPTTRFNQVSDMIQKQLKTPNFKVSTPPFPVRDVTKETKTLRELDLLDSSVTISLT